MFGSLCGRKTLGGGSITITCDTKTISSSGTYTDVFPSELVISTKDPDTLSVPSNGEIQLIVSAITPTSSRNPSYSTLTALYAYSATHNSFILSGVNDEVANVTAAYGTYTFCVKSHNLGDSYTLITNLGEILVSSK